MLSILIPTYKDDCSQLVNDLHQLADHENVPAEILVGVDGSDDEILINRFRELEALPSVRLFLDEPKRGKAVLLNMMAEKASGDKLLFVDADAAVPADFSLSAYVEAAEKAEVVCGGLRHPEVNPCPEASLRYKYERKADMKRSAADRNKEPYNRLSTFSLLVSKDTFLSIGFDPSCTDYGYEDTLFGAELEKRGISILHIGNNLIHMGLEQNEVFLKKTETALETLRRLAPRLQHHSELLATEARLGKWRLTALFKGIYKLFRPLVRRNLLSSRPSLFLFNIYKLGYYLSSTISPHPHGHPAGGSLPMGEGGGRGSSIDILISTIDEGILNVPNVLLRLTEGVRYVVSMEYTKESILKVIPPALLERDDVTLLRLEGRGLSRNRNNALDHTTADILIIADDDEELSLEALEQVRKVYHDHPEVDIALFRLNDLEGQPFKEYPSDEQQSYEDAVDDGYYVASLEITMRGKVAQSGLRFNEHFGLGSGYLTSGEEDIFIHDARRQGMNVTLFPHVIARTIAVTTGDRFLTDPGVQRAKGAVFAYCYGKPSALWRITKEALHHFVFNHRNPIPLFIHMFQGLRTV